MTDNASTTPITAAVQNPLGGVDPQRQHGVQPTSRPVDVQALIMPLALLAIGIYFTIVSPGHSFLGSRNISNLVIELSSTAVLALGMLLIILPGHIDLAAGSGAGLAGGAAAVLVFNYGWPAPAALGTATLAAILVYWMMGAIIVVQRVPAFIITLGGMLVFRGLHWLVIRNATIPVSRGGAENLYAILTTFHLSPVGGYVLAAIVAAGMFIATWAGFRERHKAGLKQDGELTFLRTFISAQIVLLLVVVCNGYQGVPLPALILGVAAVVVMAITRHTPFGRYLYAIGGNEEAAIVSGVPVRGVTIAAFAAMGLLVAITGFLQTAYSGASTTTVGENMELDAIAACVIGGTSLRGGRGTVGGVLLGALVMAVLINGMTLMAYGPESKYILRGLVLAAAVWADVRLGNK